MKIYCPKCKWQPLASSRWYCPDCSSTWNTFDTQGRCPGCNRIWRDTQCLACLKWSPHHDWYHNFPRVDLEELLEEEKEKDLVRVRRGTA